MAKLKGPLLSVGAHGALGKSLSYYRRKEGNKIRSFHYPRVVPTMKQYTRRMLIGMLTAHWQCMSDAERLTWAQEGRKSNLNIPPFNYFVHEAYQDMATHHGLALYLSFNEKTGESCPDYSGSGNPGTLKPSYPDDVPSRIVSFQKEYGNTLLFDGTNDFVRIESAPNLQAFQALTLLFWVKTSDIKSAWLSLIHKFHSGAREWEWNVHPGAGLLDFVLWDESTGGYIGRRRIGLDFLDNNWHFMAAVWDGTLNESGIAFYKDMERTDEGSRSAGTFEGIEGKTAPVRIFSSWNEVAFLSGSIDEICVYNRALSLDEIWKHYYLLRLNKKRQRLIIH